MIYQSLITHSSHELPGVGHIPPVEVRIAEIEAGVFLLETLEQQLFLDVLVDQGRYLLVSLEDGLPQFPLEGLLEVDVEYVVFYHP